METAPRLTNFPSLNMSTALVTHHEKPAQTLPLGEVLSVPCSHEGHPKKDTPLTGCSRGNVAQPWGQQQLVFKRQLREAGDGTDTDRSLGPSD